MSPKPFSDPVLLLSSNSIGKLGTLDADNLSCIWTVFTKCGENLENGRRLENLSWRLWYRTTYFYNKGTPFYTDRDSGHHTKASLEFSKDKNFDVPELSASIDSASSLDEHELKGKISDYHSSDMHVLVQESSKRPKTIQYVSPGRFQKIIMDLTPFKIITEKWKNVHNAALSTLHQHGKCIYDASKDNSQPPHSLKTCQPVCSDPNNIVPSSVYSSYTLDAKESSPNKQNYLTSKDSYTKDILDLCVGKTFHGMLVQHQSIKTPKPLEKTDKMFFIQETLPSESFIEDVSKSDSRSNAVRPTRQAIKLKSVKHISFQKSTNLSTSETSENEQSESNDINNSADDDDWDSIYDSSGSSSINEKTMFQRVDMHLPQPQLHSRRSLLSFMLQNKTNGNLTNSGSKSSPAIALSQTSVSSAIPRQISQNCKTATAHVSNACPSVVSPRTIRRNMFATELSESLRKNLLWERQQRTMTTPSTLKRRHTAYDVTRLSEFPTQSRKETHDFFDDKNYGYHAAGW